MAVVLAFRAAVVVSPLVWRLVKYEQAATGQPGAGQLGRYAWDRLMSSDSDAQVASDLSASTGTLHSVETVTGSFEVRKAQVRWGRLGGMAGGTDDAVTTHHFIYAPAGTPSSTWATAQFEAVETAMAAFWTTVKAFYTAATVYKQVRWYKVGPAIVPPQLPVRIIDPNVAGSGAVGGDQFPPQVAISITEKTADPRAWGRFYLPAVADGSADLYGRLGGGLQLAIADAADVLYEACVSASCFPVVYSSAKPSRPTASGGTLAATEARALPVHQIQVDDLFDVIRTRRWNAPLLRLQRDIAGS